MKNFLVVAAIVSLVLVSHSTARPADEIIVKRDAAERFIALPDGVRLPERKNRETRTQ
jgi:hypothetical protein